MDPMDIENIFLVNNVNQMRQQFGTFCESFDVSQVDGVSFRPKKKLMPDPKQLMNKTRQQASSSTHSAILFWTTQ